MSYLDSSRLNHTLGRVFPLVLVTVGALLGWTAVVYLPLAVLLIVALGILLIVLLALADPFKAVYLILLLTPFHTIVDNLVRSSTNSEAVQLAFSSWKEIGLLLILVIVIFDKIIRHRKLPAAPELVLAVSYAAFGLPFVFTAESTKIGILEYRNLFEGVLILLVSYSIRPSLERLFRLVKWMLLEGVVLVVWGIFSAYALDFYSYLRTFAFIPPSMTREQLQYASVFSVSGSLFLRANSIFSGPNEFGLYLAILMVFTAGMLLFNRPRMNRTQRRWYPVALAFFGIGSLISISRASWVLVAVAIALMVVHLRGLKRKAQIALLTSVLLIALLVAVPNLWRFAMRTIHLQDTSAAGRIGLLSNGLLALASNPLGIGLGNASYKFYQATFQYVHTESHILIMGLELGWPGLLFYLLMMGIFIARCLRLTRAIYPFERRLLGLISASLLIGTIVIQFMSAITMEWIFQLYLWFLVGMALYGVTYPSGVSVQHNCIQSARGDLYEETIS